MVVIEETIAGEWWWIAAVCNDELHKNLPEFEAVKISNRNPNGYTQSLDELGTLTIAGDETKLQTVVRIECPDAYEGQWRGVVAGIERLAQNARDLRRWAYGYGSTPEEAIEFYYRSKAAGGKITLGQIAEAIGKSEKRLRNIKVEYDRAGKWGSKKKPQKRDI